MRSRVLTDPHRRLPLILLVFVVTRALLTWAAIDPDPYLRGGAFITGDVDNVFSDYARQMVEERKLPYSQISIEYPPGALPLIAAPEIARPDWIPYRAAFVASMLLVDLVGLLGLLRLGRRYGSHTGAWLWVIAIFFIGPMALLRLDLAPAVATIWAVERASLRRWFGTGAWLGIGAVVKLYPLALLPMTLALTPRWRSRQLVLAGLAVPIVLCLLPFLAYLGALYRDVVGFQSARGIHIESTFGAVTMIARRMGYEIAIESSHATFHFVEGVARPLAMLSKLLSMTVIGVSVLLSLRTRVRWNAPLLAGPMFVTLALLIAVANVFSPQYVLWLVGPAAAWLCSPESPGRKWAALLLPIALLTQILFPFWYHHILAQTPLVLVLLTLRNGLVLAAGVGAGLVLLRSSDKTAAASFWGTEPEPTAVRN